MYILILFSIIFCLYVVFLIKSYTLSYINANQIIMSIKKRENSTTGKILTLFSNNKNLFLISCYILIHFFIVLLFLLLNTFITELLNFSFILELIFVIITTILMLIVFVHLVPNLFYKKKLNHIFLFSFTKLFYYIFCIIKPISKFILGFTQKTIKFFTKKNISINVDLFHSDNLMEIYGNLKNNTKNTTNFYIDLFDKALNLPTILVQDIMIPNSEIISVHYTIKPQKLIELFNKTKLSKILVYENNTYNIIGYLHLVDLFKNTPTIDNYIRPIFFIEPTTKVDELMNQFIKNHKSIAIVKDTKNIILGLVTLEDVLEELFGKIYDEHDFVDLIEKQLSERVFIFSSQIRLYTLNHKYNFSFDLSKNITLEKYILNHLNYIPSKNEKIKINNISIEILKASKNTIDIVKIKRIIQ